MDESVSPKQARREIVDFLIQQASLSNWQRFYLFELSGGQRQSVDIAIVFADEPNELIMMYDEDSELYFMRQFLVYRYLFWREKANSLMTL